ncbi:MAG: hypothetical protein QF588_05050 [Candidatus Poseidoniaceae archaeon]|nr:hypothetical protein [Candidatus Poseidoniaceae archaeon]MEE3038769.1 hypothetical protein [Candidatus Thermoplasmatota archaeon]
MGTDTLLNLLCWTPLAKPIRAIRQQKINRIARENYDKRKINSLIDSIVVNYGDLLS